MNKKIIIYWDTSGKKYVHKINRPTIGGETREWAVSDIQQEGLIILREWRDRPTAKRSRMEQYDFHIQRVNEQ